MGCTVIKQKLLKIKKLFHKQPNNLDKIGKINK